MRVLVLFSALALASQITPVTQVINLLNGMLEKGKSERNQEQVQFAAYKQFCDDTVSEKAYAIKEANQEIESLRAAAAKNDAKAGRLAREIASHEADIATWTGDKKASTAVRTADKADYDAKNKDLTESIDALARARNVLKKQNFDRSQAELLQLAKVVPSAKQVVDAFMQQSQPVNAEAQGYEFQSGGVIELLDGLHDQFSDEQHAVQKAEAQNLHAYKMLTTDLDSQIATSTSTRNSKKEAKANAQQTAAAARGDAADTTVVRDDDASYKADVQATCAQKRTDFKSRQQLRADEIEAIEEAIKIMSSNDLTTGSEHLPKLVQVSLMQLSADAEIASVKKTLAFLAKSGQQFHSQLLMQLAAKAGPFDKVKNMIQALIVRLMEEANEEAEHKAWCDTELAKNEATRNEKTTAVQGLHAKIDELSANIAKLAFQIKTLNQQVSALDREMAENTQLRTDEKAENTKKVKDAKAAQVAVAKALSVLKTFYAKAGTATALVQEDPAIFEDSYQGMQSENGGVVGMLEVIQSDFARLEAETSASETASETAYQNFMSDAKTDKAAKEKSVENKENKSITRKQQLQTAKEDLEDNEKELTASLDTFDKLKPACIDSGSNHDDRVQRRQQEIDSLQSALKLLSGEADE